MARGFLPRSRSYFLLQCVALCIALKVPNAQASVKHTEEKARTPHASPSSTIIEKLDCVKMMEECGKFTPGTKVISVEGETLGFREHGKFTLVNIAGVHPWGIHCYSKVFWHFVTHGAIELPPQPQKFEQCHKKTFKKVKKSECPDNRVSSEGEFLGLAVLAFFGMLLLLAVMLLVLACCGRDVEHGMLWIGLASYWSAAFCAGVFETITISDCYPTAHALTKYIYALLLNWVFFEWPMKIMKWILNKIKCGERCGYLTFIVLCCLIGGRLGTIIVRDSYTPSNIVLMGRHPLRTGLSVQFTTFLKNLLKKMIRDCVTGILCLCGMRKPVEACCCVLNCGRWSELVELQIEKPSGCKGWVSQSIDFIVAAPAEEGTSNRLHVCYGCLCRRIRFGLAEVLPEFKKPAEWTENKYVVVPTTSPES